MKRYAIADTISRSLSFAIYCYRMDHDMSVEKFAEHVGIPASTVGAYECRCTLPGLAALVQMADAMGCTVQDLIGNVAAASNWRPWEEVPENPPKAPEEERPSKVLLEENLGPCIIRLRKQRGKTQGQLAEAVGITKSSLCKIERSHVHPSAATICDIADALGISVVEMMGMVMGEEAKT